MEEDRRNKGLIGFISGAFLAGIAGIIGAAIGVIQIGQTERDAYSSDNANATIAAIQQEQLEALKAIATLQPSGGVSDNLEITIAPNLTAEFELANLRSTVEALEVAKVSVEATVTAYESSWKTVSMANGLSGPSADNGLWYGAYENVTLSDADKNKLLKVVTRSGNNQTRIELWEGKINPDDHYWWVSHPLEATSTGTGSNPSLEFDPQLEWKIETGEYTIFFAAFNPNGEIIDFQIDYLITKQ
jgi:hypothetical protein